MTSNKPVECDDLLAEVPKLGFENAPTIVTVFTASSRPPFRGARYSKRGRVTSSRCCTRDMTEPSTATNGGKRRHVPTQGGSIRSSDYWEANDILPEVNVDFCHRSRHSARCRSWTYYTSSGGSKRCHRSCASSIRVKRTTRSILNHLREAHARFRASYNITDVIRSFYDGMRACSLCHGLR